MFKNIKIFLSELFYFKGISSFNGIKLVIFKIDFSKGCNILSVLMGILS